MMASIYSSLSSLHIQNGLQSLNFLIFAGVYFVGLLVDFAGEKLDFFEEKMLEGGTKGRMLGLIFMCYCLITGTTTYLFSLARPPLPLPPPPSASLLPPLLILFFLLLLPLSLLPSSSLLFSFCLYIASIILIGIRTASILPPNILPPSSSLPPPSSSLLPSSSSLLLLLLLLLSFLLLHSLLLPLPPSSSSTSFLAWLGVCLGGGLGYMWLVGGGRRRREERGLVMAAHFGVGTVVMMSLPLVVGMARGLL